jgi:hypothetical protein
VMYDSVVDDVKEKGYVAISHVWGERKVYRAKKPGIDWGIPISDTDKLSRMITFVTELKKEYCWMDILCMNQDKQDEINQEIPFMGDYYAGADMTLVLGTKDYPESSDLDKLMDAMKYFVEHNGEFTKEQQEWIVGYGGNLFNISGEEWFYRTWTYQEAVLSRKIGIVGTNYRWFDLSRLFVCASMLMEVNPSYLYILFGKETGGNLAHLGYVAAKERRDLVTVLSRSFSRKSRFLEDKFFSVLGILEYKDFVVDYNTPMDDLNMKMARHAYSKGDLSWMSIGRNIGNVFIQPMYQIFTFTERIWRKRASEKHVIFAEELCIDAVPFANVTNIKKIVEAENKIEFWGHLGRSLWSWGFDIDAIVRAATAYYPMSEICIDFTKLHFICCMSNKSTEYLLSAANVIFGTDRTYKHLSDVITRLINLSGMPEEITAIKAITKTGEYIPFVVFGNVDIGDEIISTNIHDHENKNTLMIIIDKFGNRKSVCTYNIYRSDNPYISYKFPL